MAWLRQTIAVLLINLQTIPSRLGSSAVAIIGIAGVVIVFISVLSISSGFSAAMNGTGSPERALILRKGVDTEMTSGLEGSEVRIIKEAPGIRHDGDTPLASAELSVVIDLPKKSKPDWTANVPMRGIQPVTLKVRNEVSLIEGRMLKFSTDEVIVGKGAKAQFVGLNVGDSVVSGKNHWTVVGVFEADGGVAESEIWCDVQNLQSVYRRTNAFSAVLARLDSAADFNRLNEWLMKNPQVQVGVQRENEYFASQTKTMTTIVNTLGIGIASLMAIGAVFGAILTSVGCYKGFYAGGGAKGVGRPLNERDRWLAGQIGPKLAAKGMIFVGLDVIGGYVTEINVTSPTGIRELDKQFSLNIGDLLMAAIAKRLGR